MTEQPWDDPSYRISEKDLEALAWRSYDATQAEIDAPLPHHQTSLVRLNYHANGGAK